MTRGKASYRKVMPSDRLLAATTPQVRRLAPERVTDAGALVLRVNERRAERGEGRHVQTLSHGTDRRGTQYASECHRAHACELEGQHPIGAERTLDALGRGVEPEARSTRVRAG